MSQINSGLRSILSLPPIYNLFTNLVGGPHASKEFLKYVNAKKGDKLLDIGCATGKILDYLPPVIYFGFDQNCQYIHAAKKRFGNRGTFICESINAVSLQKMPKFDIVLAKGIIHHLDNNEAVRLFRIANSALTQNGRLITFDAVFVDGQSTVARFIISKDRGQNVRTSEEYQRLALQVFQNAKVAIHHNLLRIPYTHIIMECTP